MNAPEPYRQFANLFAGALKQIDLADRFVDKFAEGYQCISRAEGGSASKIRARGRQLICCRRRYTVTALPRINLAYAAAVLAKIGCNIVLAVAPSDHSLDGRNFIVVESHSPSPDLWLLFRQDATGLATSQRLYS